MDEIRIHDLVLKCIVGIHPHERIEEQSLMVNATLLLDTHQAAQSGRIGRTVHYAEVAEQIAALLCFRRYRLLEVAATELAAMLLGVHTRLERVRIDIRKPAALTGIAAAASLTIERDRSLLQRAAAEATESIAAASRVRDAVYLWHSPEANLSLQTLVPGEGLVLQAPASAPSSPSRGYAAVPGAAKPQFVTSTQPVRSLVWVLAGQLDADERVVRVSEHALRDGGATTKWTNAGAQNTRVFCCTTWCENSLT